MQIRLNGEERDLPGGITIEALVQSLGLQRDRVAVERNLAVVRRADFARTALEDGDRVEIVTFVGGG